MAKSKAKAKSTSSRATPQTVLAMARQQGAQMVDFKFVDFPGTWQHFSIPASELEADMFSDGLGFDGSSIRGWKSIHESDMLVMPDPATAFMDPFTEMPTLSLICDIVDPITREDYGRDPRAVARRAETYIKSTGVADTAFCGPEAEFFVFDDVRFDQNSHEGYYHVNSVEGRWNSGAEENPNLGYKPDYKGGVLPGCAPRYLARHAVRDGHDDDASRRRGRGAPPRGGHRRSVRDRHSVLPAGRLWRSHDVI